MSRRANHSSYSVYALRGRSTSTHMLIILWFLKRPVQPTVGIVVLLIVGRKEINVDNQEKK